MFFFLKPSSLDGEAHFTDGLSDHNGSNKPYIAQVRPLEHRLPTLEVSITPKKALTADFYCNVFHMEGGRILFDVNSNRVHVSVTA